MSNKNKAILWEELNWKDIEKLTTRMKMVIIPIGSCEQHGPHLPLGTDTIDCYEVAEFLLKHESRYSSSHIWMLTERLSRNSLH